jgi:hypothetical protein
VQERASALLRRLYSGILRVGLTFDCEFFSKNNHFFPLFTTKQPQIPILLKTSEATTTTHNAKILYFMGF